MNKKKNKKEDIYMKYWLYLFLYIIIGGLIFLGITYILSLFNEEPSFTIIDTRVNCHNETNCEAPIYMFNGNWYIIKNKSGYFNANNGTGEITKANCQIKEVCSQEEVDEFEVFQPLTLYFGECKTENTEEGFFMNINEKCLIQNPEWLDENCLCSDCSGTWDRIEDTGNVLCDINCSTYSCLDKYITEVKK